MVVLFSMAGCGVCVGFGGVGGTPPSLAALLSYSLLLCLYVNLRLSAALYAKIENTNTNFVETGLYMYGQFDLI